MKPILNRASHNMTRLVRVIMAIFWSCIVLILAAGVAWIIVGGTR